MKNKKVVCLAKCLYLLLFDKTSSVSSLLLSKVDSKFLFFLLFSLLLATVK